MRKILKYSFVLILNLLFATVCLAKNPPNYSLLATAKQQLTAEKNRNAFLEHKLNVLKQQPVLIDAGMVQRANLALSLAKADLEGIKLTLTAAQQTVVLTQDNITSLKNLSQTATLSNSSFQQETELQVQIQHQQDLLGLQQDRVTVLQKSQDMAEQTLTMTQDLLAQLQTSFQLQQQQQRQQELDKLASQLQTSQQQWLARLNQLNKQMQQVSQGSGASSTAYTQLEVQIFEAEERSNLSQIQLDLARLHNLFLDLSDTSASTVSISVLSNIDDQINTLTTQLSNTENLLQDKINLLQKRIKIITDGIKSQSLTADDVQDSLGLLGSLQISYQKQLADTTILDKQVAVYQTKLNQQLTRQLSSRQGLPGFNLHDWLFLGNKLIQIPSVMLQALINLAKTSVLSIANISLWQWIVWPMLLTGWILIGIKSHHYLTKAISHVEKRAQNIFATSMFLGSLKLLESHLSGIILLGAFLGASLLLNLSNALFVWLFELGLVVLTVNILTHAARLGLLETTIDKEGRDVKLYHLLKWTFGIGGVLTAINIVVHQLPVSYEVQDLFGRFFMLFLLAVGIMLVRSWNVVPTLLEPYLTDKKPYIHQIVRWLSLLVPLSILLNSLVGLIGYVELAWNIAAYQGLFLIVLTGYLLIRGLLGELMKLFSEQIIRHTRNGWLWSEALLKPAHQVLKILLLVESFVVLFDLYGWGSHSFVVTKLSEILNFHIITIAGSIISPISLIELLAILAVLWWAGKWSREFAYRWLYAGIKDLGLRNSLAILSQYGMVTIGIITSLRIVGINLTALTVIASAFAFGIGLGLRDLANNFVSGILLLIERPVKVGDYVNMNGVEGEVKHIGVRSVTVTTDDHKELLVPNADIFSKAFMNWTHRDTIIRKFFPIKVNRLDDPQRVKDIILEALKPISQILITPPPAVYFLKMEDMLLEFYVEYFVDTRQVRSRDMLHSTVLFALWNRFQSENIHWPEYAHEIRVETAAHPMKEKLIPA